VPLDCNFRVAGIRQHVNEQIKERKPDRRAMNHLSFTKAKV